MSFTTTATFGLSGAQTPESQSVTRSGSALIAVDEAILTGQTVFQINIAIDVSEVKSFYLYSDQDITIKTNSTSAPDNTLTITGGLPYLYVSAGYSAFILTADVTKIYVANASGSTANLKIRGVQDATP